MDGRGCDGVGMATYRSVLRSGEFRAVLGAHVFAMLAVIIGDISLTVLVYQRTASQATSTSRLGRWPRCWWA